MLILQMREKQNFESLEEHLTLSKFASWLSKFLACEGEVDI